MAWSGWGAVVVGVSDMKNAQKILGVGPGKINEKNIYEPATLLLLAWTA